MTPLELLDLMKKRIKLVIGLPIVCALLIGVYSFMFMPDTYTATTSMYVLTNQEQSAGNLSTDLSASQMVANDVTTLLNSNRVRKATADDLGLKSLKDFHRDNRWGIENQRSRSYYGHSLVHGTSIRR